MTIREESWYDLLDKIQIISIVYAKRFKLVWYHST